MRKLACILVILLAGCVGPSTDRSRAPGTPALPARPVPDEQAIRQCVAKLALMNARFARLPDRYFDGGCSAVGTVKLLDIGMPTTNLGAMTCPVARALTEWTQQALQKAAEAWLDSPIAKVESFGTYSCRPVNGQSGNRLSEHGRSNAVDISGFILASGRRITVKADWNGPDENARNFLRAVHKAGCRRFDVVLGPDANALHQDHFHFDMGGGKYCR